jgi:hypothetical protein
MDPKMRANAFSALGALSKYATGGQREGFVEQVTQTLFVSFSIMSRKEVFFSFNLIG